MISSLDSEWQDWLQHNLQQSCRPIDLYNVMRAGGFSNQSIRELMDDAYPADLDRQIVPSSINYQAIADTLAHNPYCHPDLECIMQEPIQLYRIENFLTPHECSELIKRAKQELTPSTTTHQSDDEAFRTSMTGHLDMHADPFVKEIDEKISHALGIRWPYSEPIQVQSYSTGQQLKAHHDYFPLDPELYPKAAGKAGQRTWTFTVYLNDVPKGGGTRFLYLDKTFYPKQGTAMMWNNLQTDGVPNRNTLHQGMPVEEGQKFIITKWFREHGFGSRFFE